LCRLIFSAERHFLPTFSFPFGMSLMAVITPNKKCSRG
jgi:hypothetical protein